MATKPTLPSLPALPALSKPGIMRLPSLPQIAKPKTMAEIEAENVNPLDANAHLYTGDAEHDAMIDMQTMHGDFAAIHAARKQQADAIELANDSEFWFAMYFQSREQKEAFLAHWGIAQDKYIDGQDAAALMGVTLPKRAAKYKVGKNDKKLVDLT